MNINGPHVIPTHPRIVELERLGDEIAGLSAHLEAATPRLLDLIRDFGARGGWNTGFMSCAAWLSWRVGLDPRAARERVRVARALGTLPRLAEALARGELSYSKVRALTRVATPETEERLLRVGRAGTAEHVERIVRRWRLTDRKAEAEETTRRHRSRALHVYHDEDGMVIIRARLEPEAGAVVVQALAAARASASRSRLSLPGLRALVRPGSSHPALGSRRPDDAVEPSNALSSASPRGPRRRLSGRTTGRRRALLPAPRRPAAIRKSAAAPGPCRSRRDASNAQRCRGNSHRRAHVDAGVARRASRCWIRGRRLTSPRHRERLTIA